MRVMKFGGTSVGSPDALRATMAIIREAAAEGPAVVIVSALATITNQLTDVIAAAIAREEGYGSIVERLRDAHRGHLQELTGSGEFNGSGATVERWLSRLHALLDGVALHGYCSPRARDEIIGIGERLAAPLLTEILRHGGLDAVAVDASSLIRTDDTFGAGVVDARVTRSLTREVLSQLRPGSIPIITGFVASTSSGELTTLGRGGSDYSAALIADSLDAAAVEIWTDVDGVLSADPAAVAEALTIQSLTYGEAAELARAGVKVLHPRTIEPLIHGRIPIHIRNTRNPNGDQTIVTSAEVAGRRGVKAIASRDVTLPSGQGFQSFAGPTRIEPTEQGAVAPVSCHPSPRSFAHAQDDVLTRGFSANAQDDVIVDSRFTIITAVGDGVGVDTDTVTRFSSALRAARIPTVGLPFDPSRNSIAAVVHGENKVAALEALHDALVRRTSTVSIVIVGATGRVGSALCRQLVTGREAQRAAGIDVKVVGIANSSRTLLRRGIEAGEVATLIQEGARTDWPANLEHLGVHRSSRTLFVDCTASPEVASLYGRLIERGIGIVTPNKIALSGPLLSRSALDIAARQHETPLLYETTVGAALPLLRTIRDLVATGDQILSISGVLSGTLSYILGRLHAGIPFSGAVCEAVEKGFTEPDPTIDLSGTDVARKLLILVREAGKPIDIDRVTIEPLRGSSARFTGKPASYRKALEPFDEEWRTRARDAEARGRRLVYAATFENGKARAATEELEVDSPLARTRPGENVVVIRTTRYDKVPLTIAGPGAGPEVTAAGVLAEILGVA